MISPDQEYIDSYRREFAQFEVSGANLPDFDRKSMDVRSRQLVVASTKGMRLELNLGARRVVEESSIYRTNSRYRLLDDSGRLLASAESTIALTDLQENNPDLQIVILSDPACQIYFVSEEQSWSVKRCFIVRASQSNPSNRNATKWQMICVETPVRHREGSHPSLLGIHDNHLYIQQDGRFYAFPLDMLKHVKDLKYSIG